MRNKLTKEELLQVAKAVNCIHPWTLIGALLHEYPTRHITQEDRERIARNLSQNYPYLVELRDLENAWDWFRIYGKDWGARAWATKRKLTAPDASMYKAWEGACKRTGKSMEHLSAYFPGWPFRPFSSEVFYAFDTLPPLRGAFGNEVPAAAEYTGTRT